YDSKASLMDYSARWYSPKVGRFTTEDTYAGVAYVPQTLNRYAYTLNNPVNYTDPTGHWCEYGEYSHGGDCDDPSHWVPDPVDNSGGSGGSSGGGSTGGDSGGGSGGGDPSGGSSGGDSGGSYTPPPTPAEIAAGKYSQIFNSVGTASTIKSAHSSSGNTGKLLAAVMFYKPDGEIGRIEMNPLSGTPNNGSITDYMNSMGPNASFSNREQLAQRYGISDYSGTAAQNTALLNMLRSGTSGSYSSTSSFRPVNGNNVTEEDTPISISNKVYPESTPVTTTPASESILKKVGNFILGAGDGALSELTNGVMTSPSNDSASYNIGTSAGGFFAAFVTRKKPAEGGGNGSVPQKQGGGSYRPDFVNDHSYNRHKNNPDTPSTKSKSQYGENVDVGELRRNTMENPDKAYSNWPNPNNPNPNRITKYEKEYDENISTPDTPTGSHRVFENLDDPSSSSHFPYVPRK
ncbi:RHS repeat-associated core domain-containing protein, partial [Paenibacillus alginolyticus]